jgi:hypothetical protein
MARTGLKRAITALVVVVGVCMIVFALVAYRPAIAEVARAERVAPH